MARRAKQVHEGMWGGLLCSAQLRGTSPHPAASELIQVLSQLLSEVSLRIFFEVYNQLVAVWLNTDCISEVLTFPLPLQQPPFSPRLIVKMSPALKPYQELAAKAQAAVHDAIPASWKLSPETLDLPDNANVIDIPKTCGILTPDQIDITELTLTELVAKLASGKLTSVQVTEAFCARAAIAHQLVRDFRRDPIVYADSSADEHVDKLFNVLLSGGRSSHSRCPG